MSQPESRLQRRIRRALERELGGYWYKVHGGAYQPSGLPDLNGTVRGRSCWVEVKEPDGEVSPVQVSRMRQLADAGAAVCVATTPVEACAFTRLMIEQPQLRFCLVCFLPTTHATEWTPRVKRHRCTRCGRGGRDAHR